MNKLVKQWIAGGAIAVMVVAAPWASQAAGGLFQPKAAFAATDGQASDKKVVSVTGQGEISITPDVAYVSLGVSAQAGTADAAQSANAQQFAAVEKALYETYGIDKKDVKTTSFNVQPEYSYEDKQAPKITGYNATHMITVTYRNFDKLGGMLDALSKAGANRINNVQFSTEKSEEYKLQAIEKALSNAEAKAKVIAKFAGRDLKEIINVTQSEGMGGIVPVHAAYDMSYAAKMDSAAASSVSPGEMKISMNVNVTYEF